MNSLAVLLGAFVGRLLDPVSFILVLIITLFSKQKYIIFIAALFGAIIAESLLSAMHGEGTRSWGQGIIPGFIANLLHAEFLFWLLVGRFRKNDPVQAETNCNEYMSDNNELKGLGGWLILVGIGVIFSPFILLYTYVPMYIPIFEDGTWEALTTVGSEAYNPVLIGEIAFNSIMLAASIYLIYLFFSKHYLFPKFYIGIFAIPIVFIPLDAWLVTIVLPGEPMLDPETTKEFMRSLFTALIWIPYMLFSKRVKATFVENMPNKPLKQDF